MGSSAPTSTHPNSTVAQSTSPPLAVSPSSSSLAHAVATIVSTAIRASALNHVRCFMKPPFFPVSRDGCDYHIPATVGQSPGRSALVIRPSPAPGGGDASDGDSPAELGGQAKGTLDVPADDPAHQHAPHHYAVREAAHLGRLPGAPIPTPTSNGRSVWGRSPATTAAARVLRRDRGRRSRRRWTRSTRSPATAARSPRAARARPRRRQQDRVDPARGALARQLVGLVDGQVGDDHRRDARARPRDRGRPRPRGGRRGSRTSSRRPAPRTRPPGSSRARPRPGPPSAGPRRGLLDHPAVHHAGPRTGSRPRSRPRRRPRTGEQTGVHAREPTGDVGHERPAAAVAAAAQGLLEPSHLAVPRRVRTVSRSLSPRPERHTRTRGPGERAAGGGATRSRARARARAGCPRCEPAPGSRRAPRRRWRSRTRRETGVAEVGVLGARRPGSPARPRSSASRPPARRRPGARSSARRGGRRAAPA